MKPWYSSGLGRCLIAFILIALWAFAVTAKADVIEFPEEELSRESVLPVFDQPDAVKKRFVPTDGRVEIGVFGGFSLNDPFLNNYPLGGEVSYHLSEISALGIQGSYVANSQTSYVAQIQGLPQGNTIPFNLNPSPTYMALGEFEFTPYYGKISLTKASVLNLSISATARLGVIGLNDSTTSIAGGIGLNERFFVSRNFGLKADLSALIYQKGDVIPFQSGVGNQVVAKTTAVNFYMLFGAVWYLPML